MSRRLKSWGDEKNMIDVTYSYVVSVKNNKGALIVRGHICKNHMAIYETDVVIDIKRIKNKTNHFDYYKLVGNFTN